MAKDEVTKVKFVRNEFPVIEKGIEVPVGRAYSAWTWTNDMEPGDSFMLPFSKYSKHAATNFRNWSKKVHPKWEIVSRTADNGVRVWRLK